GSTSSPRPAERPPAGFGAAPRRSAAVPVPPVGRGPTRPPVPPLLRFCPPCPLARKNSASQSRSNDALSVGYFSAIAVMPSCPQPRVAAPASHRPSARPTFPISAPARAVLCVFGRKLLYGEHTIAHDLAPVHLHGAAAGHHIHMHRRMPVRTRELAQRIAERHVKPRHLLVLQDIAGQPPQALQCAESELASPSPVLRAPEVPPQLLHH